MPKKISQQESVFDPLEQYHLSHGEFHYVMLNKINMMSFEAFELKPLYLFSGIYAICPGTNHAFTDRSVSMREEIR